MKKIFYLLAFILLLSHTTFGQKTAEHTNIPPNQTLVPITPEPILEPVISPIGVSTNLGRYNVKAETDCSRVYTDNIFEVRLWLQAYDVQSEFHLSDFNIRFHHDGRYILETSEDPTANPTGGIVGMYTDVNNDVSYYDPNNISTNGSVDTIISYNVALDGGLGAYIPAGPDWIYVGKVEFDIIGNLDEAACIDVRLRDHDPYSFPPTFVGEKLNGILYEAQEGLYFNEQGANCASLCNSPGDSWIVGYCCSEDNLLSNGDFEAGDTGFFSEYSSGTGLNPGAYQVISSSSVGTLCSSWNVQDHTQCLGGTKENIMVVNGKTQQASSSGNAIWQTDGPVSVGFGSQYKFCAYVKNLESCCFNVTPEVTVEYGVNGVWTTLSQETITTNASPCDWMQIGGSFTVLGNDVEVRILLDEEGNGDGNDIALDDISLTLLPSQDLDISILSNSPSNVLDVTASIYGIEDTDDVLPSDSCEYLWIIGEIDDFSDFNDLEQVAIEGMANGWYGGTYSNVLPSGNNWGLTTDFAGLSLPMDNNQLYVIFFSIFDCDCSANTAVFGLAGGGMVFREARCANDTRRIELSNFSGNTSKGGSVFTPEELECIKDAQIRSEKGAETQGSIKNSSSIIRPNPFSSTFSIQFEEEKPEMIAVFNVEGKELFRAEYLDNTTMFENIDLKDAPSGMYFVKMKYKDRIITKKIMKENSPIAK